MANGYFFDRNTWSINTEGKGTEIHFLLIFLIAPIIGLMFLMFLPFIGFYLTGKAICVGIYNFFETLARHSPVVGEAHLTGNKPGNEKSSDTDLDEIAKEIDARRK